MKFIRFVKSVAKEMVEWMAVCFFLLLLSVLLFAAAAALALLVGKTAMFFMSPITFSVTDSKYPALEFGCFLLFALWAFATFIGYPIYLFITRLCQKWKES